MKRTKSNRRHAVRIVAALALLFLTQNLLQSQVFTRILDEEGKIYEYIPWYFLQKPSPVIVPPIDVQAVLKQDEQDSTDISRFGIKEPMNLNKEDGMFYQFGNYSVWKLQIRSETAKSLNFEFSNLNLPEGSEMFIYGMGEKMIHGPIHSDKVYDGIYSSDIINGDSAIIEVFLLDSVVNEFSIIVDNVIHGIDNPEVETKAFGDSGACNINVVCEEGDGWENEINAVCLILVNNIGLRTGSLINNECNDFRPFILAANHSVVNSGGNVDNWVFRFGYESETCTLGVEPNTWFSFSGAQLRASWAGSDFALLELNDPVIGSDVAFAGWNRANTTPPNTVGIHHPNGDVKKISFDDDSPTINGTFHDVVWDQGTTEPGSSGSPLFDDNQLIIGQLWGGAASCSNLNGVDRYGRIFDSWTGDGTNTTRLSNWLGGVNNPTTVNTLLIPTISGSDYICTSDDTHTYTLQNPIPGYPVTWDVSPASLFGSPTSGTGTTVVLQSASNTVKGAATLTYTLTDADCGNQTFTKSIWVGKPVITGIKGPACYTPGTTISIKAITQGATNFTWSFPTCPNGTPIGDPDPDCWFNYDGNYQQIMVYVGQQGGSISVWASNACGTSSINVPIEFCGGGEPGPGPIIRSASNDDSEEVSTKLPAKVVAYPNPVNEILTVELSQDFYPIGESKNIQLLDINGKAVYRNTVSGNSLQIDVGGFPIGIFYLRVQYRGDFIFQKVIIH